MTSKVTQNRLLKALKKLGAPQSGWTDVFPAIMGKADGTVLTGIPGLVWVRNVLNGQVLAVYNSSVSNTPKLQVEVGKRVGSELWEVKGTQEVFSVPSSGGPVVGEHHANHEFPASDTVWVDRKQIKPLTVLVSDAANFTVKVLGGIMLTANGITKIATQTVDLSSHVPSTGAVFVSIESDDDGAISINAGTGFAAPAIATVDDIPSPAAGKYTRAYVLLYEGQTALSNDDIVVPMPPDFNPVAFAGSSHVHALDDLDDVNAPSPTDGQVLSWDDDAEEWIAADQTGGGVTDHGDLDGLEDDDHTQYQLKSLLTTLGDMIYASADSTWERLAGNTDAVRKFLRQLGDGSDSAAPAWDTLEAGDIPDLSALYYAANGWLPVTETWTRTGDHSFTTPGNLTSKYRRGAKIRYRDGGSDEYGVIYLSSFGGGITTVQLIPTTDYAMAAATITDTYISYIDNPEGWPEVFNYAPTYSASGSMTFTTVTTVYAKWRVSDRLCFYAVHAEGTTGSSAAARIDISCPVPPIDLNTYPGACAVNDGAGGAPVVGTGGVAGAVPSIFARKADSSNWGLGSGRLVQISGFYPF